MSLRQFFASAFPHRTRRSRRERTPFRPLQVELLENRSLLTSLVGADVSLQLETTRGAGSPAEEVTVSASERATVQDAPAADPEFDNFQNLFDIDLDGDVISMVWSQGPGTSTSQAGVVPAGTFYRFFFDVQGLPDNVSIQNAVADSSRNLVPNVALIGDQMLLVEIGPGMQLGPNRNALIDLDLQAETRSIDGTAVTVTNTMQSSLGTSGQEVPNGDPVTVALVDDSGIPELTSFAGRYDIDLESDIIRMWFSTGPGGGADPSGVIEPGTFDRYYFDFDLGPNEFIANVSLAATSTVQPNVTLIDSNSIRVEFGPGMEIGDGLDAYINFEVGINGSEVSGRKWNDLNNDGIRTSNEPWLNGWQMQLLDEVGRVVDTTHTRNIDLNNDGLIANSERGIYLFTGVQDGEYTVAEVMQPGWVQSHPVSPLDVKTWELNRDLELEFTGNDFLNWGSRGERWLFGAGQWYFITPDGNFFRWDGSPRTALTGDLVESLAPEIHRDLARLYDAPPPQPNRATVTVPEPVTGLNFGNYLAPPTLALEQDHPNNTVTFTWDSPATGSTFELWITDLNTRRRHLVVEGITDSTFTTTLPDRQYRVWIRTEYEPGVYSRWSGAQDFEFKRDPLVAPFTGVAGMEDQEDLFAGIDGTPTLQWDAVANTRSYDLQVTSARTGAVLYLATGINGTEHRVATELPLGNHFVALRANYTDGSRNEWGNGQLLQIDGRPVVSITGNRLWWDAVPAANEYEVWVDRIDAAGNRLQRQAVYVNDIKDLFYDLPNLSAGRYKAWVRAIRAEGGDEHYSYWSAPITFVAQADSSTPADIRLTPMLTALRMESHPAEHESSDQQTPVEAVVEEPTKPSAPVIAAGNQNVARTEVTPVASPDIDQLMQHFAVHGV